MGETELHGTEKSTRVDFVITTKSSTSYDVKKLRQPVPKIGLAAGIAGPAACDTALDNLECDGKGCPAACDTALDP